MITAIANIHTALDCSSLNLHGTAPPTRGGHLLPARSEGTAMYVRRDATATGSRLTHLLSKSDGAGFEEVSPLPGYLVLSSPVQVLGMPLPNAGNAIFRLGAKALDGTELAMSPEERALIAR